MALTESNNMDQWGEHDSNAKTTAGAPFAAPASYAATLRAIETAPRTWLGGILACVVKECVHRKFFRDAESLQIFVRNVSEGEEDKLHNEKAHPTAAEREVGRKESDRI